MKSKIKFLSLLLAIFFVFSFAVGCDGCNDNHEDSVDSELSFEETGKYIDQTYKIVLTDANDTEIYNACVELQNFIKDASGIMIPIVRDNTIPEDTNGNSIFNKSDKYLCVGNNNLSKGAGVEYSKDLLGLNGYSITTVGDSVFMGGYGSIGSAYSVYTFLKYTVGFRAYSVTSVYFDTVDKVPLLAFDFVDVPDIEWRPLGYGISMATPNKTAVRRLKSNLLDDCFVGPQGIGFHNQLYYLPAETYYEEHPAWYSETKTQLCFNAHGIAKEYDALVNTAFEEIKKLVISNPNAYMISFQHMDNTAGFCNCKTCQDEVLKYGGYAGSQNQLLNDISAKIDAWVLTNEDGVPKDKEIFICGFAYQKTLDAPVIENADGSYTPIDRSVVLGPHVSMMYAPIEQDIMRSLHEEENANVKENIEKWKILCPNNLTYYLYQVNAHNYMFPTGGYQLLSENYKYVKDSANILFDYGQWDQPRTTGFHEFKIYWDTVLMWDTDANFEKVKQEYFNGVFGDAAPYMLEMFDEVVAYVDFLAENNIIGGGIYAEVEDASYWPYEILSRWQGLIEKSFEAIEPLKESNPEKYEIIYDEINLESLFTRYALISFYGYETMTENELKAAKNQFVADCDSLSFTMYYETIGIKNIIGSWVTD